MALLQKSRISQLRNGDENIAYIHATIKERRAAKSIYELLDRDGKWLKTEGEIQHEITQFYRNLQGATTKNLVMLDKDIMRKGRQVNANNTQMLVREVNEAEIKEVHLGISDNKAPRVGGFNAYFFKKAWDIIKQDLTRAIKEFFDKKILFPPSTVLLLRLSQRQLPQIRWVTIG